MLNSMMAMMARVEQVNENLKTFSVVPIDAGQGWNLDLFEISQPIAPHHHKLQSRMIIVVEGELSVSYTTKEQTILKEGDFIHIDPASIYSLIPNGTVRFFSFDLQWQTQKTLDFPPLDHKCFSQKFDRGMYNVYELLTDHEKGGQRRGKWGVALIELKDSPKHFHKIEKELFVVTNGELIIKIDGAQQILGPGSSVLVSPEKVHHLKSTGNHPVRLLCFSFPAFDIEDMHLVE